MIDIKEENRAFFWASVFIHSLSCAGIDNIVISPGSRSTPLTLAAADCSNIKTHVILDERSAAFFALGIGKATKKPAALICTSGTSVANYYPAVIEARMSSVPLLVLTADRPPHLRNTGANQAIDQRHIFGKYPVFYHDVIEPVMDNKKLSQLADLATASITKAIKNQGPVHLNFPFSKPLEPEPNFISSAAEKIEPFLLESAPFSMDDQAKQHSFGIDIHKKIRRAKRPLIIIGQLASQSNLSAIFKLSEQLNAPVLSESGFINSDSTIEGFEGFLRNKTARAQLEPDLILRFGRQPASKSVLLAVKTWSPNDHIYFLDSDQQVDIDSATTMFRNWNGNLFEMADLASAGDQWIKQWKSTEEKYVETSEKYVERCAALTDGHVYHRLVPQIPSDWFVFVSNSFPARDRSMFSRWKDQPCFSNRGASGIDGITSTAMGISTGLDRPGILFTGDLAFLHDTNALLNAKKINQPLVIVVINNSGGSIFRMLPVAEHGEYFSRYFETPQQVDIQALTASYGTYSTTVDNIDDLQRINLKELVAESETNVVVLECRTDPDASMELRNKLWGLHED